MEELVPKCTQQRATGQADSEATPATKTKLFPVKTCWSMLKSHLLVNLPRTNLLSRTLRINVDLPISQCKKAIFGKLQWFLFRMFSIVYVYVFHLWVNTIKEKQLVVLSPNALKTQACHQSTGPTFSLWKPSQPTVNPTQMEVGPWKQLCLGTLGDIINHDVKPATSKPQTPRVAETSKLQNHSDNPNCTTGAVHRLVGCSVRTRALES